MATVNKTLNELIDYVDSKFNQDKQQLLDYVNKSKVTKWLLPDSHSKGYKSKVYPRFRKVSLNYDLQLKTNNSPRSSITSKDLSNILYHSVHCGISKQILMNNSLEIYPLVFNIPDIQKGLYHYNFKGNYLELLEFTDSQDITHKFISDNTKLKVVPVAFFITSSIFSTHTENKFRGIRNAFIEVGRLQQVVCDSANLLGIATDRLNNFNDDKIARFMGLDETEYPLLILTLGI